MTPVELAAYLDGELRARGNEEMRLGQQRFFQHEVDTYGVPMREVTALVRETYRVVKPWPLAARNELMKRLWETKKLESGALVCHVYRRFSRQCTACEFQLFTRWIDRYVRNWAHTDGVASWLLAACIANEPALRFELRGWTESDNRWKRRASAVALLQEAKQGRHTEFIFEIARRLLPDRDDMVEKGVGWLLKETYPRRPEPTLDFLLAHADIASRVTLRYAAEKIPPAQRSLLFPLRGATGPA
jgi:3-methyladenine DNA glycosylase AlkD